MPTIAAAYWEGEGGGREGVWAVRAGCQNTEGDRGQSNIKTVYVSSYGVIFVRNNKL